MEDETQVDSTTVTNEENDTSSSGDEQETVESLRERLDAKEKAFEDQKRRAELAETKAKEKYEKKFAPQSRQDTVKDVSTSEISPRDIFALTNAGLTSEEDISLVERFAKVNNTSLRETLKDSTVMGYVRAQQELRATSNATSTSNDRRGNPRKTSAQLLSDAKSGVFPDSKEDLVRLVSATIGKE